MARLYTFAGTEPIIAATVSHPSGDDPALKPTLSRLAVTQDGEARSAESGSDSTPAEESQERSIVGQPIGQYRVIRRIGRGGMGVVYEAVHESIGQRVAIKTLNQELSANPAFVKRFFNEARATVIAQHPGLVKIFDYGQLPHGLLYIQMEFLEGETMGSRLAKVGRLPVETAVRWTRQIASAMAVAHARDIIHRDLKPDNTFVVPDREVEGGERIKILDFGLAKILRTDGVQNQPFSSKYTSMGGIVGTPAYMAPEQFRGEASIAGKADVYSLGVMLFEMLTGELPFAADSVGELMLQHLQQEPPDIAKKRAEVPAQLGKLLVSMLAKEAARRPSMIELEQALATDDYRFSIQSADSTKPVGGSISTEKRSSKGSLRQPILIGSATSVVVMLAGGFLIFSGITQRKKTEPAHKEMIALTGGRFTWGSSPDESKAALLWCQRQVSDGCREEFFARETPPKPITIAPFLLDRTEVTNQQFSAWLRSQPNLRITSERKTVYLGELLFVDLFPNFGSGGIEYEEGQFTVKQGLEQRPATQLTWYAADAYCRAHGKRLPTEAEWEYAARSGQRFRFPWGDNEPLCSGVVFARHSGWACGELGSGTEDVGTAKQDRSAQGVLDLAGNVSEWTADSFHDGKLSDPSLRVVRGGDWHTPAAMCRAAGRSRVPAGEVAANIGFRCAK